MTDLRNEREAAALIKYIRDESEMWQSETFELMVWTIHELVQDDEYLLPELTDTEVHDILAEMPTTEYQLLDEQSLNEVFYLEDMGVNYESIALIIEDRPYGPDEISRETIRRYCDDANVEVKG